MKEAPKVKQSRNMMLVLTVDWLKANGWPTNVKDLVAAAVSRYPKAKVAGILHDEDVYTAADEPAHKAGEAKPPHIHIAMALTSAKTPDMVARKFGVEPQFVERFDGKQAKQNMFSYLTHRTNEAVELGKFQYAFSQVDATFDYAAYMQAVAADAAAAQLEKPLVMQQVLDGSLRLIDFIRKDEDGGDTLTAFYINNKSFVESCIGVRYARLMASHGSEMHTQVIYIQGCAGSGKTSYAKRYALKKYRDYYFASSKNDPLQDYKGEEVIIFDDARPDMFGADDWLRLLDPYTNESSMPSRFFNKYLAVKCIILTSIHAWEDFFRLCPKKGSGAEPVDQFLRRFSLVFTFPAPAKRDAGTTLTTFSVGAVAPTEKYEYQYVDGKGKQASMELGYRLDVKLRDKEFVIAEERVADTFDASDFDV